jgi:elongation factor Ts
LWVRTWDDTEDVPEWFVHGLKNARPCLGMGIVEPLELRLSGSKLVTVSAGNGKTLLEHLTSSQTIFNESTARGVIEQLCYALLRVHLGQGRVHAGLTPFNVLITEDETAKLWSVPAARLELSFGAIDSAWEAPYRSPQLQEGRAPTVADDIYSLGKLLLRLLCKDQQILESHSGKLPLNVSPSISRILQQCVHPERDRRFQSVVELASALDPETSIAQLDLTGACLDKELGVRAFLEDRVEDALAHWSDARRKDWLDLAVYNNLGVARGCQGRWDEAIYDLERAYKLFSFHPLVDCNIGYCQYKLGDLEAADFWLGRACTLNPGFGAPFRRRSEIALDAGHLQAALKPALEALMANPRCRESRRVTASVLDALGEQAEAERHRAFARQLEAEVPFSDHLITKTTSPPWSLVIGAHDSSIFKRLGASPRGPVPVAGWLGREGGSATLEALASLGRTAKSSNRPWAPPWRTKKKGTPLASLPVGRISSFTEPSGKVGVLLEFRCESESTADSETLSVLMQEIAMHIAAENPAYLSREEVPSEVVEQRLTRERQTAIDEGNPGPLADKLAWGRTERILQSQCLLEQPFQKDYSKTVEDHLKEVVAKLGERVCIKRFLRFEVSQQP